MDIISTHAPLAGSDLRSTIIMWEGTVFQPTLPSRGATTTKSQGTVITGFQPTLPSRGATIAVLQNIVQFRFQPTLPSRGATDGETVDWDEDFSFQPTLPSRGATGYAKDLCPVDTDFNPRSPRGERPYQERRCLEHEQISTHAPLAGSDIIPINNNLRHNKFQPTLPSRGATRPEIALMPCSNHFNPRSPRGERHLWPLVYDMEVIFQPTLPSRGATSKTISYNMSSIISTHAPLAGSDVGGHRTV